MYILKLRDNQNVKDLLIFKTHKKAVECVESFPYLIQKHDRVDDLIFSDYYFKVKDIPLYLEWDFEGRLIPLSKLSYEAEKVYFEIHQVDDFESIHDKVVAGSTKIDAWMIDHEDMKEYILNRENIAEELLQQLHTLGFSNAERMYFGSEDGEAIRANTESQWFFAHLDPMLVDGLKKANTSLEKYVKEVIDLELSMSFYDRKSAKDNGRKES